MKKKLKLDSLKVQSFVTQLNQEMGKIAGGTGTGTGTAVTNCAVDTCTTGQPTEVPECTNIGCQTPSIDVPCVWSQGQHIC